MIDNYPSSTWNSDNMAPWNEEYEYESRMCYECAYYRDGYHDEKCIDANKDWHACPDFVSARDED